MWNLWEVGSRFPAVAPNHPEASFVFGFWFHPSDAERSVFGAVCLAASVEAAGVIIWAYGCLSKLFEIVRK